MEHEGSDTESFNSSISASANNSNEHLKPLPGAKSKVWKVFWVCNKQIWCNSEQSTSEVHSL